MKIKKSMECEIAQIIIKTYLHTYKIWAKLISKWVAIFYCLINFAKMLNFILIDSTKKKKKKTKSFCWALYYTFYNRKMTMPLSFRIHANYLIFFAVFFSFFRLTSSQRSTIFRMKYFNECARIQLPCSQSMP